jgi:hypothetical protein
MFVAIVTAPRSPASAKISASRSCQLGVTTSVPDASPLEQAR